MPKAGVRFYAVRTGREGPKVYTTWDEVLRNTDRFPGAVQKSFKSQGEAEAWINVHPAPLRSYTCIDVHGVPATRSSSQQDQPVAGPSRLSPPLPPAVLATSAVSNIKRESDIAYGINQDSRMFPSPTPQSVKNEPDFEHGPYLTTRSSPVRPSAHSGVKPEPSRDVEMATPTQTQTSSGGQGAPGQIIEGGAPVPPAVQLSDEQRTVLDMVKRGKNVFFTGSAGTGKSVLLREIIKHCRLGHWGRLAITASTGIASVNIGGSTVHSWAGIGLGKETAEKLVMKLLGQMKLANKKAKQKQDEMDDDFDEYDSDPSEKKNITVDRWRNVRTLIVDEISMIDGVLFDKLEYVARALRKNGAPFGGIQLVLSGDFCQLPPVPDRANGAQVPPTFAFDAKSWERCVGRPIVLTKVFRQKDQDFVDMLNGMRFGHLEPPTITKFRSLSRAVKYDDGLEPTDLFPTRREVDAANTSRLNKLRYEPHVYNATDTPGYDDAGKPISLVQMERLLERLVAPKSITLKVGAQVMLIKNMVQGQLVNGSVGRVIGFKTPRDAVQTGIQIAVTEASQTSPYGKPPPKGTPRVPEHIMRANALWPIVQFQNGVSMLCVPAMFEVNDADGKVEASRAQIPLILAWALSIHKSQGQTLERVRVNLGRIFEKGQAYVALSRATSMNSLQVLNFDAAKVMAHPRVLAWMEDILVHDIAKK